MCFIYIGYAMFDMCTICAIWANYAVISAMCALFAPMDATRVRVLVYVCMWLFYRNAYITSWGDGCMDILVHVCISLAVFCVCFGTFVFSSSIHCLMI